MKNINKLKSAIIIVVLFAFGLGFVGCEKENSKNIEPTLMQNKEINSSKAKIIIFTFTWDEWGRKKKNCRGGGLCNFRLKRIEIVIGLPKTAPVYKDDKNNYFVELPIDDEFIFEDDSKCLFVDEDIVTLGPDGHSYTLLAGAYSYDRRIGKLGGYVIPLVRR